MRRRAVLLLTLMMTAALPMWASPAWAKDFTVNSTGEGVDYYPGDGFCDTVFGAMGTCTLRAAIEEANVNDESDTIRFDPALSGTITLTLGELEIANDTPAINDLIIQGPGARKITVSGNDASRVFYVNYVNDGAHATISGLTISDGVDVYGGGILNGGTLELTDATISNNTSTQNGGGGVYNYGPGHRLEMTNTTVSGNTAATNNGGGIYNVSDVGSVTLSNTIIASNSANTAPDASGTFSSQGKNLIGNTTGATGFVASDLKNVNPLLGRLQDNGGPTDTRALLPGSPAVDAGRNTTCPFTDQRGVVRKDGDKNGTVICDIGAFERNDFTPPKVTTTTPSAGKTGVRRNANLIATFSEKMDRATLTSSTFKLYRVNRDGTLKQVTNAKVGSTTDGLKATLNPFGTSTTVLAANTKYKAVVTTGAKDRAGNRLDQNRSVTGSQPMQWTFTTGSS